MEKHAVYNNMSFNTKRVPKLIDLKKYHAQLGDTYLNQFKSSDALIGPVESVEYLDKFFNDDLNGECISKVLSMLTEAKDLLFNRVSAKYSSDMVDLEKVINSINNKLCITSQK